MENIDYTKVIGDLEARSKKFVKIKPNAFEGNWHSAIGKKSKVLLLVLIGVFITLLYNKPQFVCTIEGIGHPKQIIWNKFFTFWLILSGIIYGIIWYFGLRV